MLLCGVEACPVRDKQSLEFTISRSLTGAVLETPTLQNTPLYNCLLVLLLLQPKIWGGGKASAPTYNRACSLMKLFRTGSANVIIDCQKQFHFLPVSYLMDIRTTKFMEKLTSSENLICSLFAKQAADNIKKYSSNMEITSSPVNKIKQYY